MIFGMVVIKKMYSYWLNIFSLQHFMVRYPYLTYLFKLILEIH